MIGSGQYFKLNDFGVGLRSTGWHNLKVVESTDDGLSTDFAFYVDSVLAESVSNVGTAASIRSYDNIALGSGLSNANTEADFDNMALQYQSVPEPASIVSLGVLDSRGRLELKTDDAGTIYFEWDIIIRIQSVHQFEVETANRQRLYGALATPNDRRIQIGDTPTLLPLEDLIQITPIGVGFWAKLEGKVDAGFSYTKSSGVAQVNLNGDVRYRRPAFLVHWNGSATLTEQSNGDQADDRAATELQYARYRGPNWFISGATRFETNESLGLELRSQIGGLVGRRLISTNQRPDAGGSRHRRQRRAGR